MVFWRLLKKPLGGFVESPEVQFPVTWGTQIQDGPDGNPWIVILVNSPFSNWGTMMPVDVAEDFLIEFPRLIRATINEVRKQQSKIVVVPANAVNDITKGTQHD